MFRKPMETARRVLKTWLILGSALLFVTAITGCDQIGDSDGSSPRAVFSSKSDPRSQMAMNHNETILRDATKEADIAEAVPEDRE